MPRHSGAVALLVAAVLTLAGACESGSPPDPDLPRPTATRGSPSPDAPELGEADRCAAPAADFTCATLRVPLDHAGGTPGTLELSVAMTKNEDAPRGVLVFLTGGPGQPAVPFAQRLGKVLEPVLGDYRLVLMDQRGTGPNALSCPALQRQMGSSDLTAPTVRAVKDCAAAIGENRRFYSTADTVADLDLLRRALGAERWTLDGVSYGTYTAQHYALAHPHHVARLVLDSVVPHSDYDTMVRVPMVATARVLKAACAEIGCETDPVADLREAVIREDNGAAILDMLTTYEFTDPDYREPLAALREAALGDAQRLNELIADVRRESATAAAELSQGLHASTLCLDGHFPWGTSDSEPAERREVLEREAAELTPDDYGPYDPDTATGTGSLLSCLHWPRTRVPPSPAADARLPDVPVLLLGGDRDLSTPVEWLYEQAELIRDAEVVVVRGAAHSVQSRAESDEGRKAVYDFLLAD